MVRKIKAREWNAMSGDTMSLEGDIVVLNGTNCANPDHREGREAHAFLNAFLHAGHVSCGISWLFWTSPRGLHGQRKKA